jgi:hypothetical protein
MDFSEAGFEAAFAVHMAHVPQRCVRAQSSPTDAWRCSQANVSLPFLASRVFAAEALTDRVVTTNHAGLPTLTEAIMRRAPSDPLLAYVARYTGWMRDALRAHFSVGGGGASPRDRGLFAPACYDHTAFPTAGGPQIQTRSFLDTLHAWLFAGDNSSSTVQLMDTCAAPLCGEPSAVPALKPGAVPRVHWPRAFFAKMDESWPQLPHLGNNTGSYALDLAYSGAPPHVGAEAIARSDGTGSQCANVHPNTPCTEVAKGGQRYFIFPALGTCCRCCSWANGCGPVEASWAANATLVGARSIGGRTCDDFKIMGYSENHVYQAQDASAQLCGLDNGGWDVMLYRNTSAAVPPALFDVPAGCAESCGCPVQPSPVGHCDCD